MSHPNDVDEAELPQPIHIGEALKSVIAGIRLPRHDEPCLGCGTPVSVAVTNGFTICPPCDRQLGPEMTWDERTAIWSKKKTIRQVLSERGRPRVGSVGDRLHIPALFERAVANDQVREWNPNKILVLRGPTGIGKTHQAAGALRLFLESNNGQGYLVNCANLSRMSREEFQVYTRCSVLALDDLGSRLTPGCLVSCYELIEHRQAHKLALIVTTNLTMDKIMSMDERIASRLGAGAWIELTGQDRRLA